MYVGIAQVTEIMIVVVVPIYKAGRWLHKIVKLMSTIFFFFVVVDVVDVICHLPEHGIKFLLKMSFIEIHFVNVVLRGRNIIPR